MKKKAKTYHLHMELPLPLARRLKADARKSGQTLSAHLRILLSAKVPA